MRRALKQLKVRSPPRKRGACPKARGGAHNSGARLDSRIPRLHEGRCGNDGSTVSFTHTIRFGDALAIRKPKGEVEAGMDSKVGGLDTAQSQPADAIAGEAKHADGIGAEGVVHGKVHA